MSEKNEGFNLYRRLQLEPPHPSPIPSGEKIPPPNFNQDRSPVVFNNIGEIIHRQNPNLFKLPLDHPNFGMIEFTSLNRFPTLLPSVQQYFPNSSDFNIAIVLRLIDLLGKNQVVLSNSQNITDLKYFEACLATAGTFIASNIINELPDRLPEYLPQLVVVSRLSALRSARWLPSSQPHPLIETLIRETEYLVDFTEVNVPPLARADLATELEKIPFFN